MAKDFMNYTGMVDAALRGVVHDALVRVQENGLPGNHHFYLSFRTKYPGVVLPGHLRERYPDEMTIVLQHQFWGLEMKEQGFEVTLSFKDVHEYLFVPFAALSAFADPSVQFGLQLKQLGEPKGGLPVAVTSDTEGNDPPLPPKDPTEGADVVALDKFRKK